MLWRRPALIAAALIAGGCDDAPRGTRHSTGAAGADWNASRALLAATAPLSTANAGSAAGSPHRIILSRAYGYSYYSGTDLPANTIIDARRASWRLSSDNRHPFRIYSAGAGLRLEGGTVRGEISQTLDWRAVYDLGNSAAVRVRHADGVTIKSWRIDKTWDAFRVEDGTNGWLIEDAHVTDNRDDAVENDKLLSGTLRDSLIDGTYSGISMDATVDRDGSMNIVTLDHVFMRLKPYPVRGRVTHGGPIKGEDDMPKFNPRLRFIRSVIAIEDVNHDMRARTREAWNNAVEARQSYFLNLSDTPLPPDYPLPPTGFTVLQGKQARDYWAAAKAAWLDNHDGTPTSDLTPLPILARVTR